MTATPAPVGRAPLRTVDPAAAVARTRPRTTITETVSQTLIMAWRAPKKMRRNPEQLFDVTLQPLLFTAMFAYIFGGAISGNVHSYLPLLILDPLSASLLGMFLFREHIQAAVPYLAGEAAALAIVIASATALSHSQLVVGEDEASPTTPAGYQAHSHRQQAGR